MNILRPIFMEELKRRLQIRDIIAFIILTSLLLFFVNEGKNRFINFFQKKDSFQEVERTKVKSYVVYTQLGTYGISLLYIPSSYCILFYDSAVDGMISNVNAGDKLDIFKPLKGRNLFTEESGYMTFLGIILLFGSLIGLIYGYDTTQNKVYLTFISSISNPRKIFFASVISRIIILNLALILSICICLFWVLLHKINLFHTPLLFVILFIVLINSFFFSIGCIIGTLKSRTAKSFILLAFYFCSLLLIPWLADKYSQIDASDIEPLSKFELKNLKVIMGVEKRLINKFGFFDSGEIAPPEIEKAVKDAVNIEHKEIRDHETRMKNNVLKKIKKKQVIYSCFPVLHFLSTIKEISGQGGLSFTDFYSFAQERKAEFIDFYVDKKFLKKGIPGQIENFVKGDENVFYAQSKIPVTFWPGAIITLIYTIIGLIIAYFLSKKQIFPKPEFKDSYDLVDLKLETGKIMNVTSYKNDLAHQIKNAFLGKIKKGFNGKISIDGKSIVNNEKEDCVIIPGHDQMPGDIQAGAFLTFIGKMSKAPKEEIDQQKQAHKNILEKRFYKLEPHQIASLQLAAAELKPRKTYIFRNFCSGIPGKKGVGLLKRLKALKEQGALVLDILKDNLYNIEGDFYISYIFEEKLSKYITPADLRKMEEQEEEELD